MNIDDLKDELECSDIDSDLYEEVVKKFNDIKNISPNNNDKGKELEISRLKNEIVNENDWKKRAIIKAKIISLGIE